MNDPRTPKAEADHAWSALARTGLPKRSAAQRVTDFLEIYGLYDEVAAQEQASRCIQCPEPTCVAGCPLSQNIPEWLALTAEGRFLEAATALQANSSMPEICARICPADRLCEGSCVINGRTEPVSIWAVEQFLSEYAFFHQVVNATVAPPNGWRVAIIGAGPGGLSCADELAKFGFAVTVFDSRPQPGGVLVYGTPAFRLERSIVQRRIDILRKRGVVFRLGVTIGMEVSREELQAGYDAVYLSFSSKQPRTLAVPGIQLAGVAQARPFIIQKNSNLPSTDPLFDVTGKRVIVLGGGDTAIDCVRTALRCGAREAIGVYRRDEESMPGSPREFENAKEEGARFVFQAMPLALLDNGRGRVAGLRLVRTLLREPDPDGRRPFSVQLGTEFELETDWVFLALGFDSAPLPASNPFHELTANNAGRVTVDGNQMTAIPGTFAGGDLVRGPGSALNAVRDARKAATGIQSYCLGLKRRATPA
jgi:glutamate synthase (NADPH/NADH) small chain